MVRTTGARATLALLLLGAGLAGCGGGAATPPARSEGACSAQIGAHVTVVVEVSAHTILDRCVAVGPGAVSAETVMHRSGVTIALQHFSFGDAVCALDHVPPAYTQCFTSGAPYWALFVAPAHGLFRAASTGISGIRLRAGETLGWRYLPAKGPVTPPPLRTRR
ncbi:MAG TPA: hypothetical protein VMW47_02825 [Verrucomicrobiae bacterium]|nr:hypothetical protein [Verrucomicrobiae bacterium]